MKKYNLHRFALLALLIAALLAPTAISQSVSLRTRLLKLSAYSATGAIPTAASGELNVVDVGNAIWTKNSSGTLAKMVTATSAGAVTVTGALTASGGVDGVLGGVTPAAATVTALTASGATILNGGLTMDSTAFTVADTSGNTSIGGTLGVTGAATFTRGAQNTPVAVTATADGLTTGIVAAGTAYVTITSANSAHIVTLPVPVVGNVIRMYVGANGCEVRTVAASNVAINTVDSDGSNQAALPATTLAVFTCVSATEWILTAHDELGAPIAAIVPDAP